MDTTTIQLTDEPIQITDGSNYAIVQELQGKNFRWCNSILKPDKESYHYTSMLNIGLGASIWIWNPTSLSESKVSITTINE